MKAAFQQIIKHTKLSQLLFTQSLNRFSTKMTSQQCIDLENKHGCHNYHPLPVVLKKGQGIFVWDCEDRKYYDFLSGYSTVNQGHCHPKILQAMVEQGSQLTLVSRAFYNDKLGLLEKYLCELLKFDKCLLMNTGAEAVESSLKIAKKWAYDVKKVPKYQAKILFAAGNFHGRTIAVCSGSEDPDRYEGFGPFGLGHEIIEYNDVDALEKKFKSDPNIAAFIVEPIQGERGVFIPSEGYLKKVRELCTKYNVLWIDDEIQTGMGRTGKLLAVEHEGVQPDMVLIGKALAGGFLPVSAILTHDSVMQVLTPGTHGSTFGGYSLASAVAKRSVEVIQEEKLVQNSKKMGEYFLNKLKTIKSPYLKEVRGRGLFTAVEFYPEKVKVAQKSAYGLCLKLKELGLLAKHTHDHIIRFTPPLIITQNQIDQAFEIIKEGFAKF